MTIGLEDKFMMKYLALGDSYTIGEAVKREESFPFQVLFGANGMQLINAELKIIATTGWTTSDLKEAIFKEALQPGEWSVVSLLIGVNNQYQNKPFTLYEKEFKELLDTAISLMDGRADKVMVVSIPDYSVTPFAGEMDKAKISKELKQYNSYAESMVGKVGSHWINITDISLTAENEPSLIASDGLHPSAKQYSLWTKKIYPVINKILSND